MPEFPSIPLDVAGHLFSALTSLSEDGVVATDLRGTVRTWNEGAERIFGYTADEMIGESLSVLMPGGQGAFTPILHRVVSGERLDRVEAIRIAKGGRLVRVSIAGTPVQDEGGRTVGAVAVVRALSEQPPALPPDQADARFRSIVDSAVDGVIVIDDQGRIESVNHAGERLFGYTEAELMGQNVSVLMPSPYREEHDTYIARYLKIGAPRIIGIGREVTGLTRDGREFPVHLSVGEWQSNGRRHFTGILHDLTQRVRLESQLREQSTLARLGEMATVIAHEVRNPLAAVRGAIQVIGGRLPKDSRDAPIVKHIVARLDALDDLIEELLLFARRPQPRMGNVSLAPLLALTADLLTKDPSFADVRISIAGEAPTIQGDRDLLQIAFQNLLINAAQAMQGKGTIRVQVGVTDSGQVVRIVDEGPGIPPEVLSQIFRPFFTTKARGTGLGLSIAQHVLQVHDGTLTVESPAGGGTIATVTLRHGEAETTGPGSVD